MHAMAGEAIPCTKARASKVVSWTEVVIRRDLDRY